jgi:hypothetical protein
VQASLKLPPPSISFQSGEIVKVIRCVRTQGLHCAEHNTFDATIPSHDRQVLSSERRRIHSGMLIAHE